MLYKLLVGANVNKFSHSVIVLMDRGIYGPRLETLGVPVYSLEMRQGQPTFKSILLLRKFVQALEPDLIQGWMYHGNLAANAARSFDAGQPIIFWNIRQTLYDIRFEKMLTRFVIRMGAYLSGSPNKIIYNSVVSAEQHEANGFSKKERLVIPNGFDTSVYRRTEQSRARVRSELDIKDDQILVGCVARFHAMKDYGNLIRAAAIVRQKQQNVKYAFVGSGVDYSEPAFRESIQAAGLASACQLLGERHDVVDLMSAFDVLVLPSAWGEGFPNVLGEAMSCELPCIVTNVGDSALILDKCGIVVPPSNAEELADAILKIVEQSPQERRKTGEAARQRIKELYSVENIVAQYECEYANALNCCTTSVSGE